MLIFYVGFSGTRLEKLWDLQKSVNSAHSKVDIIMYIHKQLLQIKTSVIARSRTIQLHQVCEEKQILTLN